MEDYYYSDEDPKDEPCVGICYLEKLKRLEEEKKKAAEAKSDVIDDVINEEKRAGPYGFAQQRV